MAEKWIETLLRLADEYQMVLQLSSLQIQSIVQHSEQRAAIEQCKRKPSILKGKRIDIQLNKRLEFMDGFPFLVEKMVFQLSNAINDYHIDLKNSVKRLGDIIDEMIDLERQVFVKAKYEKESVSPIAISLTQASQWIENQLQGYKLDYFKKHQMYKSLDFSKLSETLKEWNRIEDVDFREQATIDDRLKVFKSMGHL